jgi:hypothetical protein
MKIRQIIEELKYQWWKRKQSNIEYKDFCRRVNAHLQKRQQEADARYRKQYESALDPFGLKRSSEELFEVLDNPTKKVE